VSGGSNSAGYKVCFYVVIFRVA